MVNFKEIYHFSRFQRGYNIFLGVQLFPGGGGGSNCLFPIETNITSDFPGGGGSGPPVPPSGSALDSLLLINKTRHADNNYLHVWISKETSHLYGSFEYLEEIQMIFFQNSQTQLA